MAINQLDMGAVFNNALGTIAAHRGMQQQQEYRNFLRDNGEALMAGDPGALAGYAQYDPGGALSMRNNMNSERRASQLHERKMAEIAANMSAQERAQELQTVRMGIQAGANARTPEEWDATVGSIAPGLKGRFGERKTLINQAMTWEQFLSSQAPKDPADEYGRYVAEETAAGREPLDRIGYAQAKKGQRVVYGPDGKPILFEGAAGAQPPDLTVDAAKNTGFLLRTQEANKILNQFEQQGTDFWQGLANDKGGRLGNFALTSEFQQFDQARRDFVNAILRRESGAVISDEEFANAEKQYFPVPGDSPEVIEQKRRNRETAIEGIRVGSGEGATYVDAQRSNAGGEGGSQPSISLQGADLELFEKYGVPTE